jgi:hypothetical protein
MAKKYTHQEKYTERQRARGLTRVTVWVPQEYREQLIDYAERLSVKAIPPPIDPAAIVEEKVEPRRRARKNRLDRDE